MNINLSFRQLSTGALLGVLLTVPGFAQHQPPGAPQPAVAASPYAPYEFLMGDWDVMQPDKPPFMVMHFKWGGGPRGYIFYNASMLKDGAEETHFEGMLIWNAVSKNLDMLLTLDPTHGETQERGTVYITSDGTVVRQIQAIGPQSVRGPDGKPTAGSAIFRQTFKQTGPDEIKTVVLRDTLNGWVPTFPGSENLIMKRRAPAGHTR